MDDQSHSITRLLNQVRSGRDEAAAQALWEIYQDRLTEVAQRNLASLPKRVADEDDVAQSAMNSFFRAAETGRLQRLNNREDLWKLLVTITARKARRIAKKQAAKKRGEGRVDGESGFYRRSANDPANLASIPDEDQVNSFLLECDDLVGQLPQQMLQEIALKRLEGYEIEEIAEMLGVSQSTIKRKLKRIRDLWASLLDQ